MHKFVAGIVRHRVAAVIGAIAAAAVLGCAGNDIAVPDKAVVKKQKGANWIYCDNLVVSVDSAPSSVRTDTDFDVRFLVVNDDEDACVNEATPSVSGHATLNPSGQSDTFSISHAGGDDGADRTAITGHFHSSSTAGSAHLWLTVAAEPEFSVEATVTVAAPPTAPSSLTASAIDSTTATAGWTNGSTVTGITTQVQQRVHGGSWPGGSGSSVAAGVTSLALTGLSPLTAYDVRIALYPIS